MQFTDTVTVSGTRRTADGYLVAEARSVRTGIQLYAGSEVGKPEMATVDPAYFIPASGLYTNVATNNTLIGKFETSTAGATQLAVLNLQ